MPNTVAAWYFPFRAGSYNLVCRWKTSAAPDSPVQELRTGSVCIHVVASHPDVRLTVPVPPMQGVYVKTTPYIRIDCRDAFGNIRINPLDNLLVGARYSSKYFGVAARVRADVGTADMKAATPIRHIVTPPKSLDRLKWNTMLGILGADDVRPLAAPDGTLVAGQNHLIWRCIPTNVTYLQGTWSLAVQIQDSIRCCEKVNMRVIEEPGSSLRCNAVLPPMTSQEIVLCRQCAIQSTNKCFRCEKILLGRTSIAKACPKHAMELGSNLGPARKCGRCRGLIGFGQQLARLCNVCSMKFNGKCSVMD